LVLFRGYGLTTLKENTISALEIAVLIQKNARILQKNTRIIHLGINKKTPVTYRAGALTFL